jgi:hypothetical protein
MMQVVLRGAVRQARLHVISGTRRNELFRHASQSHNLRGRQFAYTT